MRFHQKLYRHSVYFRGDRLSERISYHEGIRVIHPRRTEVKNVPRFKFFESPILSTLMSRREIVDKAFEECTGYLERIGGCELFGLMQERFEQLDVDDEQDQRYCNALKVVLRSADCGSFIVDGPLTAMDTARLRSVLMDAVTCFASRLGTFRNNRGSDYLEGPRRVFLPPRSAGYFFHETVGHLLEQDLYRYCSDRLLSTDLDPRISLRDDISGHRELIGLNRIDDEGTVIRPTQFISSGRWCDTMRTRQYDDGSGTGLRGFARAESFLRNTAPRMRMTILDPPGHGDAYAYPAEEVLLDNVHHGILVPGQNTFRLSGTGYLLRHGKKVGVVTNLSVAGDLFTALKEIPYIGSDLEYHASDCGKNGQTVRVGHAAPSIAIDAEEVTGDVLYI